MRASRFILAILLSGLTLVYGQIVLAQQTDDIFSKACQKLGSGWNTQTAFSPINICARQVPGEEKCGQGSSAVDCFGCATSYITGAVCCQKNTGTASEYQCVNTKNQGFNTAAADATGVNLTSSCLKEGYYEASIFQSILGPIGLSCAAVNCCEPNTCQPIYAGNTVAGINCLAPEGTYKKGDTSIKQPGDVKFTSQVTIPGTIFTKGKPVVVNGDTLGAYIAGFYKFFVGFMAVVAVVMIMWGGFKRIMAAGNAESVKNANGTIFAAIIGLVITLLSYTLLNLINPSLVKFQSLDRYLIPVARENLEFGGDIAGEVPACSAPKNLTGFMATREIIDYADSFVGKITYHLGAKDPTKACTTDKDLSPNSCNKQGHPGGSACFDCSGFTSYVYKCVTGENIPSSSSALVSWNYPADKFVKVGNVADLQAGDIFGWGPSKQGGNSGHVMLVYSRDNNAPNKLIDVHGSCRVEGAAGVSDISFQTLANKCLEDDTNRCFYYHFKLETDSKVDCESAASTIPCGLRKGVCSYKKYDEYKVEGLSNIYRVGNLQYGCSQG